MKNRFLILVICFALFSCGALYDSATTSFVNSIIAIVPDSCDCEFAKQISSKMKDGAVLDSTLIFELYSDECKKNHQIKSFRIYNNDSLDYSTQIQKSNTTMQDSFIIRNYRMIYQDSLSFLYPLNVKYDSTKLQMDSVRINIGVAKIKNK